MLVEQVMTRDVVTVAPDADIEEAARKMNERNVGCLVVVENDRVNGILVDRQLVTHVLAEGKDAGRTKVKDVMTKDVKTVAPDETIFDACQVIAENGFFRRLPVVDGGRLVGIVSVSDLASPAECLSGTIMEELRANRRAAKVRTADLATIERRFGRGPTRT